MIVRMRVSVDLLSFLLTEQWIPVLSAFLTNMRVRAVLSSQKSLLLSLVLSSALIFCQMTVYDQAPLSIYEFLREAHFLCPGSFKKIRKKLYEPHGPFLNATDSSSAAPIRLIYFHIKAYLFSYLQCLDSPP